MLEQEIVQGSTMKDWSDDPSYYERTFDHGTTFRSLAKLIMAEKKEMFYLTMHWTHFILRLYGIRHMVKDHLDRGNPLLPHGILFPINSMGSSHRQDSTYHRLCYTIVEHWLEREIAQWVLPMKDRSDGLSHHERTLLQRSYISLHGWKRLWCCILANIGLQRVNVRLEWNVLSTAIWCQTYSKGIFR